MYQILVRLDLDLLQWILSWISGAVYTVVYLFLILLFEITRQVGCYKKERMKERTENNCLEVSIFQFLLVGLQLGTMHKLYTPFPVT